MNAASLVRTIPAERIKADETLQELYYALKKVFENQEKETTKKDKEVVSI